MIKCSLSIIRLSSFCGDGRAKIKNGIKKYAMSGRNPRHNVNNLSQNYTETAGLSSLESVMNVKMKGRLTWLPPFNSLVIDVSAVSDIECDDIKLIVFNEAYQPIVTYSVSPLTGLVCGQSQSVLAGVFAVNQVFINP